MVNSFIKNIKVVWVLLILFLGMNTWLLYKNSNYKSRINLLQRDLIFSSQSQYNKPLFLTFNTHNIRFYSSFKLIAIFSETGCISCIDKEINHLNKWAHSFEKSLLVYYTGKNTNLLKERGAIFDYQISKNVRKRFNINLSANNPIIFVVDKNNIIHHMHTNNLSLPYNDMKRKYFYKKTGSLFKMITK